MLQMCLGSGVAVVVAGSCSSDLTPSLGISKKKKEKKRKKKTNNNNNRNVSSKLGHSGE